MIYLLVLVTDAIKRATEDETAALNSMSDSFERMLEMLHETEEGNNKIVELVKRIAFYA